jgi:hypothetical protein
MSRYLFFFIFLPLDPDPGSGSGSTKSLNPDLIRIHNPAFNALNNPQKYIKFSF